MATEEDSAVQNRIEEDEKYRRELFSLFKNIRAQAVSNIEHFKEGKSTHHERFLAIFTQLYDHLDNGIEPGIDYFLRIVHLYDFDAFTPGNGYRSFVKVIHRCCLRTLQITRHITVNRDSFLFRSGHYCREIDAYTTTLGQLRACLYYLQKLVSYCEPGDLFPDQDTLPPEEYRIAEHLMMEVETLNQECFYGRVLGFQYCPSLVKPLMTISLAMASFADGYEQNSRVMKLASSLLGGSKYLMDPESRAKQVINVTRNGDINFCQAFWSIAENGIMHQLPLYICPSVQLDKVIILPPEPFEIPSADGSKYVKVTPPCAHSGPGPVHTRLLSYHLHRGQEKWKGKVHTESRTDGPRAEEPRTEGQTKSAGDVRDMSPYLVIQCHGGGFVAQSSASHESYLRSWAKDLGCPILCVDYSLAPGHPFPRQLEEVFYTYCWALKNHVVLGWTGEKVVLTGDSAGGNLVMAVAMRLASKGVRQADGILCTYGTVLIRYTPSPARLLSLMDPLLPIGIVASVLAAYSGLTNGKFTPYPSEDEDRPDVGASDSPKEGPPVINGVVTESDIEEIKERSQSMSRHKSNPSKDSGFLDSMSQGSGEDSQSPPYHSVTLPACTASREEVQNGGGEGTATSVVFGLGNGDEDDDDVRKDASNEKQTSPVSKDTMRLDLGDAGTSLQSHRDLLMSKSPSAPAMTTMSKTTGTPVDPPRVRDDCPFWCPPVYAQTRHFAQSPVLQFRHMPIATNPYMSPFLAPEELICKLPKVCFLACHLDPMLDDSVMLAKRMKKLGRPVHLDVLDDLPHGFLNFVLLSQDAKAGSDLCVLRIKELFGMATINDEEFEVLRKGSPESQPERES